MRIGPVELSAVKDWDPAPGVLVSWHPTPASCAKALAAPVSAVPPSYVQARQIRSFSEQAARGLDHSRLLIASVEVFGHCDLRAMTYVINAHLRRHDTYRSWFELRDTDHIVRHSIADPADIEFVPTTHGEMTSADLRQHIVATPDSLHWDCFSFGVIQRADSFTFYASIDHLHADGQFVGVGLMEFQSMYTALIMGEPPIGLSEATGADTYFGITPKDIRTPADLMTQGWFTGQIPVTVPVAGLSFNEIARIAQTSFDTGADLAKVPFERVVELSPSLRRPQPLFSLVNFFDAQVGPLSAVTKLFEGLNVGTYSDGRVTYPLSTMVGRFDETAASVLFPDNPVARESVTAYLRAIRSVCMRIANGGTAERVGNVVALSPGRRNNIERMTWRSCRAGDFIDICNLKVANVTVDREA